MKLINADLLLDRMSERCEWCTHNDHRHTCRHECEWREAMDMVDDASEVEAEPVRHCKLAFGSKMCGIYGTCTACKEEIYIADTFNYCPNCGAKVDGETWEPNSDEVSK